MTNLTGFDANEHKPLSEWEPIPEGEYTAEIVSSEMVPTKSGNGEFLELVFEINSGPCSGRVLSTRLNLKNPNSKAVEIAQRELATICRAVNVMKPSDSMQLHNRRCVIKVVCEKKDDKIFNRIKNYKPYDRPVATNVPETAAPWA